MQTLMTYPMIHLNEASKTDAIIILCQKSALPVHAHQIKFLQRMVKLSTICQMMIPRTMNYKKLPVYFINIQYKHMKELILVNGQTGKVVGNIPFETEQLVIRTIKNSLISCTIFSLLCILFLSIHRMQIVLILPILVAIVALINGSKEYNRYKSGMIQLASQHMISYVNRKEEQDL